MMPLKKKTWKSICGGFCPVQCCITSILFTWLAVLSLLCDSALAACGAPPTIDKAVIDTQTATDVRYKCNSGYEPGSTRTMASCVGSDWVFAENRPLVCRRVSCGTPPDKDHASYNERSFLFGDDVRYNCDTGYKQVSGVTGYNSIQCQPNEKWTVIAFGCGPVTCPALSDPANGKVRIVSGSTGKYDYNHRYKFTCDTGFLSKGRQTVEVTCTASGDWTEKDVTCDEGICTEPPTPVNGIKLNEGNKYGDLREYKCDNKYEMVVGVHVTAKNAAENSVVSLCQKDGSWSQPTPTCRLKPVPCTAPAGPPNGYAERVNKDEYRMKCNKGYKLQSGNSYETVTCQSDGTWTFNPAVCIEDKVPVVDCGQPKIPLNGELVKNDGKTYTVRCKNGYKLHLVGGKVGDTVSETCQSNGQWTQNNNPVCKEETCDKSPTPPANGKIQKDVKDVYIITCDEGYVINGKSTVICVNGRWSPTTTTCKKEAPSGMDGGTIIGITIGSIVAVVIIVGCITFITCRKRTCKGKEVSDKESTPGGPNPGTPLNDRTENTIHVSAC